MQLMLINVKKKSLQNEVILSLIDGGEFNLFLFVLLGLYRIDYLI